MKLRTFLPIAAAVLGLSSAPSALAITLNYQISGGDVTSNTGSGLLINTALSGGLAHGFSLDDNQSTTFAFFDIWTTEGSINWGEDNQPRPISATLNFSVPSTGATVLGTTVGGAFNIIGLPLGQQGVVTWDGPVIVALADRVFEVTLSNAVFNQGFLSLGDYGATVEATVKQLSSVDLGGEIPGASVPDSGATALLLGSAFLGLVGLKRRLRA